VAGRKGSQHSSEDSANGVVAFLLMSEQSIIAINVLHEFFPERAQAVLEVLKRENSEAHKIEEWREVQLAKFIWTLILAASDLERAYKEKQTSTLAWLTRNLLELSVWIQFCNMSPEHAKRFRDDAVRDLYGFSQAVQSLELSETGAEDFELKRSQQHLSTFAQSWGIHTLGDDYQKVSGAAEEVGRGEIFRGLNKMLSKYAHPTAWAVHSLFSVEADAELRDLFLMDGVEMATDSLTAIRNFILKSYPSPGSAII